MLLGDYPTKVSRLENVERAAALPSGVQLWCKHDERTSPLYGGNKIRKLEHLLDEATAKGAKRLLTIGAVGSHHVLATTLFGTRAGFEVGAILTPQPWTPHVEQVARVAAGLGLQSYPVGSFAGVPLALARRIGQGTYFIPPGGSSASGSLGYVEAARELARQIARGDMPRPTVIVVALGSGGTAAGLLVGLLREGLLAPTPQGALPIELLAVQVVDPPLSSGPATLALALAVRRKLREPLRRASIATLSRSLRVVRAQLGGGYGHSTPAGDEATRLAITDELVLDPTYTAKTFAGALVEARARRSGDVVLYWHTLAAPEPFSALLSKAPGLETLKPELRALLRR